MTSKACDPKHMSLVPTHVVLFTYIAMQRSRTNLQKNGDCTPLQGSGVSIWQLWGNWT